MRASKNRGRTDPTNKTKVMLTNALRSRSAYVQIAFGQGLGHNTNYMLMRFFFQKLELDSAIKQARTDNKIITVWKELVG